MGAAMGFSPREVGEMSMWEFQAAVAGWMKAHVPEDAGAASDAELENVWADMVADGVVH